MVEQLTPNEVRSAVRVRSLVLYVCSDLQAKRKIRLAIVPGRLILTVDYPTKKASIPFLYKTLLTQAPYKTRHRITCYNKPGRRSSYARAVRERQVGYDGARAAPFTRGGQSGQRNWVL
jgi:hypothetical protein